MENSLEQRYLLGYKVGSYGSLFVFSLMYMKKSRRVQGPRGSLRAVRCQGELGWGTGTVGRPHRIRFYPLVLNPISIWFSLPPSLPTSQQVLTLPGLRTQAPQTQMCTSREGGSMGRHSGDVV